MAISKVQGAVHLTKELRHGFGNSVPYFSIIVLFALLILFFLKKCSADGVEYLQQDDQAMHKEMVHCSLQQITKSCLNSVLS